MTATSVSGADRTAVQTGDQPHAEQARQTDTTLVRGQMPARGSQFRENARADLRTAQECSQNMDTERDYRTDSIDAKGIVRRRTIRFQGTSTPGSNLDRAEGGYFTDQSGRKFHTTGTTERGEAIIQHGITPTGEVELRQKTSISNVFTTKTHEIVNQLGLKQLPDPGGRNSMARSSSSSTAIDFQPKRFSRRGYSGTYTLQYEKDGSLSLHYTGGKDSAGYRCPPQTFHHGDWDKRRSRSLMSRDPREQQLRQHRYNTQSHQELLGRQVLSSGRANQSGFYSATKTRTSDGSSIQETWGSAFDITPDSTSSMTAHISQIKPDPGGAAWGSREIREPGGSQSVKIQELSFSRELDGEVGMLRFNSIDIAKHQDKAEQEFLRRAYEVARNADGTMMLDRKIAISNKQDAEIFKIAANGDVYNLTTNEHYKISLEAEGISWNKGAIGSTNNPGLTGAPTPGATPTPGLRAGEAPTPQSTPLPGGPRSSPEAPASLSEAARSQSRNEILAREAVVNLYENGRIDTGFFRVEGIIVPPKDLTAKIEASAAFKIKMGEDKEAYVFTRNVRSESGGSTAGIFVISKSDLESKAASSPNAPEALLLVALENSKDSNLERGFLADDSQMRLTPIKIEQELNVEVGSSTIGMRLRSDGSFEQFTSENTGNLYVPLDTSGSVKWMCITDAPLVNHPSLGKRVKPEREKIDEARERTK